MSNAFSRFRLGIKFFFIMMLLIGSIITGMLYLVYSQERRSILNEVEARALDLTTILAFSGGPAILANDYLSLQKHIDSIRNRPDFIQVMILDLTGKVLAHCNVSECDRVYADSLTQRILRAHVSVIQPIYVLKQEHVLDVATPIFVGANQKVGFARAIVSLKRADEAIRAMTWRIILLGAAGVAVAFILVAYFSRVVTQPLRRLDQKALQISRGERDIQIEVTARDEIGHLQQALKMMIEEVRRQSRLSALGTTTASLAHEIRTPLIVITRYINELLRQTAAPELGNKLLGEVNQLNDLVKQLLQFSKKSKLTRSRTDINDLVEQTLFLLEGPIQEGEVTVHRDLQPLPIIAADKNLLQSVLRNLISNALEAMSEAGELVLQTKLLQWHAGEQNGFGPVAASVSSAPPSLPGGAADLLRKLKHRLLVENGAQSRRVLLAKLPPEKQAVMITIRDNGHGIPKENMDQLFLPFFTTKKNGNGLGLALSHKIIQEHQGSITVESEEGLGTTFTILLPV